jgi:ATP-dependent DNA helicase RecG
LQAVWEVYFAVINRIQGLYQKTTRKHSKNYQKTTRKLPEIQARLLVAIKKNPTISRNELSIQLELSGGRVQHNLRKLIEEGVIRREGADKGGHWVVIKE